MKVKGRWCGRTLTQIDDELNGKWMKAGRGRGWHTSSIREILLNEANYWGGRRGDSRLVWRVILS